MPNLRGGGQDAAPPLATNLPQTTIRWRSGGGAGASGIHATTTFHFRGGGRDGRTDGRTGRTQLRRRVVRLSVRPSVRPSIRLFAALFALMTPARARFVVRRPSTASLPKHQINRGRKCDGNGGTKCTAALLITFRAYGFLPFTRLQIVVQRGVSFPSSCIPFFGRQGFHLTLAR